MKRLLPPGPAASPFGMKYVTEIRDRYLDFGKQLQQEFGDIVHFRLGPVSCVQLFHPEHIQECLIRNARHFKKSERFKTVFGRSQGESVVTSDGEHWVRQRQLLQPGFGPEHAERFSQIVVRRTEQMLDNWPASGVVDVTQEMRRLTLGISLESLFGVQRDEQLDELGNAIETVQKWGFRELNRMMLTPRWLPLIFNPRARRALNLLNQTIDRIIREHRPKDPASGNLLDVLMNANSGHTLSLRELQKAAATMLVISHETITIALTWAASLLARHQHIQKSITEAVRLYLGERSPSHANQAGIVSVEVVFQETLRLYPPVYVITREVASEVTIGGYLFAPGTQVFISSYQTQRDPRWFQEPELFNPSRFDTVTEKPRPVCSMLPFGAGPRGCLGRSFATMQGKLTLATILQRFELHVPEGETDPIPVAKMHLRPRDNVRLVVKRVC